jgi:hypothetical protein
MERLYKKKTEKNRDNIKALACTYMLNLPPKATKIEARAAQVWICVAQSCGETRLSCFLCLVCSSVPCWLSVPWMGEMEFLEVKILNSYHAYHHSIFVPRNKKSRVISTREIFNCPFIHRQQY